MPPTIGLVGDFTKAVLFDRESRHRGGRHDHGRFVRSIVRILAELRFRILDNPPEAFARVSLVPGS